MPRSVQLGLGISVDLPVRTQDAAADKRKHYLIRGRPRRLEPGAKVVKVAITPRTVQVLDRIRERMQATRPEAIRTFFRAFVEAHGNGQGIPPPDKPIVRTPTIPGQRCEYLKIPFSPIERRDIDSLCRAMAKTRQQLINLAIDEALRKFI